MFGCAYKCSLLLYNATQQNSDLEALLAQLRETQDTPTSSAPPSAAAQTPTGLYTTAVPSQSELDALLSSLKPAPALPTSRSRDVTTLSWTESIPVLQRLASDGGGFLAQVHQLRATQDKLERDLKQERDSLEMDCKRKGLR